jgi:hypothetical protein
MLAFNGCVSIKTTDTSVIKRYTKYSVAKLPDTWRKESFRDADLFFQHTLSDATIYVSAQCEKVSDSPLIALTSQMLTGMGKYEIISQTTVAIGDRDALISEVNVNLDGVHRYLKIMVIRKNRCVYDAVLSARTKSQEISEDFDNMVQGFGAEAEL